MGAGGGERASGAVDMDGLAAETDGKENYFVQTQ